MSEVTKPLDKAHKKVQEALEAMSELDRRKVRPEKDEVDRAVAALRGAEDDLTAARNSYVARKEPVQA